MSPLRYRDDWQEARERLAAWWQGEDFGRAVLQMTAARPEPIEHIEPVPRPEGVICDHYTAKGVEFRVNLARRNAAANYWLGEAAPSANPADCGANCLALYLGCNGIEKPTTVWFEPCMTDPDNATFEYDPENPYWQFTRQAHLATREYSEGTFMQQFPDLIEGLDTLAAMRGTDRLLTDLMDRPQWVHDAMEQITQVYFRYYDWIYDVIRDEIGGSYFWCWAPGSLVKLQCDFSAMISPGMFREFMVPVLEEMTARTDYSLYHWDGPGALPHLDALLSLDDLDMIQWTPGAGQPPTPDEKWWPIYHEILDTGRRIMISASTIEQLAAIRNEFGEKSQGFLVRMHLEERRQAEECMRVMEV